MTQTSLDCLYNCCIILYENQIPLFIYILVSDINIIKQTVRRKCTIVETTETREKSFSSTVNPFYAKVTIKKKELDVELLKMMVLVSDTFYCTTVAFPAIFSACLSHALSVRSQIAHPSQFWANRSASFALTVHQALTVRSQCVQNLPFRFNSTPLPFETPASKDHLNTLKQK